MRPVHTSYCSWHTRSRLRTWSLMRCGMREPGLPDPQLWLAMILLPLVAGHAGCDAGAWAEWWCALGAFEPRKWWQLWPFAGVAVPSRHWSSSFTLLVGPGAALDATVDRGAPGPWPPRCP